MSKIRLSRGIDYCHFGSDCPFITPQGWLKDLKADKIEFKPKAKEKLF
jgi:hypothetical protein